jgi:altronate hydrolase
MSNQERLELTDYAIIVNTLADNIALTKKPLFAGTTLQHGAASIRLLSDMLPGQRFSLRELPEETYLIQYGYPFARSKGILPGEKITSDNTLNEIPPFPDHTSFVLPRPHRYEKLSKRTFLGYRRVDGRCGTRNYYIVVPTSMCASAIALQIAAQFSTELPGIDGVMALPNTEGCGCSAGMQIERFLTVLKNSILHENVAGALIVDLGCEQTNYSVVKSFLGADNIGGMAKPIDWLTIQSTGGAAKSVAKGVSIVSERTGQLAETKREPCRLSSLTIGSECGASDAFSGVTANRVIGEAVDRIIAVGGSAVFSEFPEMVGAEQALFPRMKNKDIIDKFNAQMDWYRRLASLLGTSMDHNLVPENKAGGLINPFIKSLGAIMKGGTSVIQDVLDYGEKIASSGLHIMQGPGNDLESVTGLAASGANVICFSTGRGTITGCALVPVIKISSTSELYVRMTDDMDFNAGAILESQTPEETLVNLGESLLEQIIAVASGQKTKPEINCQRQFQIWTAGKLSL